MVVVVFLFAWFYLINCLGVCFEVDFECYYLFEVDEYSWIFKDSDLDFVQDFCLNC